MRSLAVTQARFLTKSRPNGLFPCIRGRAVIANVRDLMSGRAHSAPRKGGAQAPIEIARCESVPKAEAGRPNIVSISRIARIPRHRGLACSSSGSVPLADITELDRPSEVSRSVWAVGAGMCSFSCQFGDTMMCLVISVTRAEEHQSHQSDAKKQRKANTQHQCNPPVGAQAYPIKIKPKMKRHTTRRHQEDH